MVADPTTHVSEDQMINVLHGLASREDDGTALTHLKSCPECEARFRVLVREREELAGESAPGIVGGRLVLPERPAGRSRPQSDRPGKKRWRVWGALAAAAVVLIVLLPRFQGESDPFDYWLPTDDAGTTLRSTQNGTAADFLAGLEAYRRRDAREALQYFEKSRVPEGYETLRSIFLASALILNERFEEAREILTELDIPNLPSDWRRRSWWLLYIALRKGDDPRAVQVLDELIDVGGEIGERARAEKERRPTS